jgi:hypothetical protein
MRTLVLVTLAVASQPALASSRDNQWVRFSGEGFSAMYPSDPIVVHKQEEIPAGRLDIESHQATDHLRQFTVTVTKVPHTLVSSLPPEKFLDSYRDGLSIPEDAVVAHEEFHGRPALVLEWRTGPSSMRQRAFLVKDRLFALTVGWPTHQSAPSSDIVEFERSLSFDDVIATNVARTVMKSRDLDTELAVSIGKWSALGLLVVAAAMFSHRAIRQAI